MVLDLRILFGYKHKGLYSYVIGKGKATTDGKFEIAGLPEGIYVLSTIQGNEVVDCRTVKLPSDKKTNSVSPVEIESITEKCATGANRRRSGKNLSRSKAQQQRKV